VQVVAQVAGQVKQDEQAQPVRLAGIGIRVYYFPLYPQQNVAHAGWYYSRVGIGEWRA